MDHQAFAQLLGNYGEFIGAIAVVATLGYLAFQVRHASRQFKQTLQQTRHAAIRQNYLAAAQTPQIARVLATTTQNWSDEIETEEELFARANLSPEEIIVWQNYQRAWWAYFREMIGNVDVMPDSEIAELNRGILAIYEGTPAKVYFRSMKSISSPAVVYVNSLIPDADLPSNNLSKPDA